MARQTEAGFNEGVKKILAKSYPGTECLDDFSAYGNTNRDTYIRFKCGKCGTIKKMQWRSALEHGFRCGNKECILDKRKATNNKKYGCDYPMQNKEILEKAKQTTLINYGVERPAQNADILKKMQATSLKRYGVTNPGGTQESLEKAQKTTMEKYGVKYWAQRNKEEWQNDVISSKEKMEDFLKSLGRKVTLIELNELLGFKLSTHSGTSVGEYIKRYHLEDYINYLEFAAASNAEREINKFLLSLGLKTEMGNREILDGKEIDIYIPALKIGIEYCGIYWHSSNINAAKGHPKNHNYHYNKMLIAQEKGVRLVQIFENEYLSNKDIVLDKLAHICQANTQKEKIYARNCEIKKVTYRDIKDFLRKNHIQGPSTGSLYIGAYYNNEIIATMVFKNNFRNVNDNQNGIELCRFATDIKYNIVGIFSKMLKYSTQYLSTKKFIYSYADLRWVDSTDNVYSKNGWLYDGESKPDYTYINIRTMQSFHKSSFQKSSLKLNYPELYDDSLTELEITEQIPYLYRIYDCGKIKYKYNLT